MGRITANAAWLVLAAISFNPTRAAGTLASRFHARATTATTRAHLVAVPARIARSARRLRLRLPARCPWETAWQAPPRDHPPTRPDHPAPTGATKDPSGRPGQTGNLPTPKSETTRLKLDQTPTERGPVDRGSGTERRHRAATG